MDATEILKYLIAAGLGLIPSAVLVFLFLNPDKFEHWMKLFYSFLYWVSSNLPKIRQRIDRRLVAVSIQDTVNSISDKVNAESPNCLPHPLKLEWVSTDTPESFIARGKTVVRLNHYSNQDRNIVDSTLLYLKQGFLPRAKHYLDKTLRQGCEYKVAIEILLAKRETGAYDYFIENNYNPAIKVDGDLEKDMQTIQDLDLVGYFTRVFLTEVSHTGQKLLGAMPTNTVCRELRDFSSFLSAIATKGRDENPPLLFNGTNIKAQMILVAKAEILDRHGIKPYVTRLVRGIRDGYDSIYLCGWGERFVKSVQDIKNAVEGKLVTVINPYIYEISAHTKAILLVCQPSSSYLVQQQQAQEEVKSILTEIVPEIKNGTIRVMSIARTKGLGVKIAVKAESQEISDAKSCCIGRNLANVKSIRSKIPNEFISFVQWSENQKDFIINSLVPLHGAHVNNVGIDEETLVANVFVDRPEAAAKAIGKNGNNVRLASELTGWVINVDSKETAKKRILPEEELRDILLREIPEIGNGEIEIVRIVRLTGIGSKVIVKPKEST
ncbi:hypothetical protein MUO74_11500, partial [Candidatus Bathyarchaeota archaeon]|nr:hypothetical protein [Candidatus Bathyarchaeota archaeon]